MVINNKQKHKTKPNRKLIYKAVTHLEPHCPICDTPLHEETDLDVKTLCTFRCSKCNYIY